MKIFDSLAKSAWSGNNFDVNNGELTVRKNSFLKNNIGTLRGRYHIKIIGKKRTGNGKLDLSIVSGSGDILHSNSISFTKRSYTEVGINFNSDDLNEGCLLCINRGPGSYGTLEIAKISVIYIGNYYSNNLKKKTRKVRVKNNIDKNMDKKISYFNDLSKRKMCIIIPYSICGGAEIYLRNLINNLNNDIFDIHMIYMKKNKLKSFLKYKNIYHFDAHTPEHLKSNLIANNYDYLIYYNSYNVYNIVKSLALDNLIDSFIYEIYHSDFIWNDALSKYRKRHNIGGLFTISNALGNDISGVTCKHTIPVGINIQLFESITNNNIKKDLGIGEKKVIGTVSRLSGEKNVDYIIKLANKMKDFHFIIIGDGPAKNDLISSIKKLKLTNVTLTGYIQDVNNYYAIFDAFILASKCNEGTPISILEAMAAEVPVFTTFVGAIPSFVENGFNGIELKLNIEEDYSNILKNIDNDFIILNAKKYVIENHNISDVALKFSDVLLSENYYEYKPRKNNSIILKGYYA